MENGCFLRLKMKSWRLSRLFDFPIFIFVILFCVCVSKAEAGPIDPLPVSDQILGTPVASAVGLQIPLYGPSE